MKNLILIFLFAFVASIGLSQGINIDTAEGDVHLWLDDLGSTILIGKIEKLSEKQKGFIFPAEAEFIITIGSDEVFYLFDDDGWGEEWEIWTEDFQRQIGYAFFEDDNWLKLEFVDVQ